MIGAFVRNIRRRFVHARRGVDPDKDVRRILPATTISTIFDVGANVGRSAKRFRRAYPEADIYAFEPDPENFLKLRLARIENCRCCHVGLGDSIDDYRFDDRLPSDLRRIADNQNDETLPYVPYSTVDAVANHINIDRIDYLKIDTMTDNLKVVMGAKAMLDGGKISIVETACAADLDTCCCTSLERHGFRLFETYQRPGQQPNVLYISPQIIRDNTHCTSG